MVPQNRVGQSWTLEIAASRIAAVLVSGDLHLVSSLMACSEVKQEQLSGVSGVL